MSWHFSRALVEACSPADSSDGDRSAPSRSTNTTPMYWCGDRTTAPSPRFRSGTMSARLTVDHGEELLTSFRAAFPVRTSQSPEPETASTASAAGSGESLPASLARYDPGSRSWKTRQLLLFEDSTECLAIFPRWGLMRDGELWALTTPEHLICARGSGFWPTPTAQDANNCGGPSQYQRKALSLAATVRIPTPTAKDANSSGSRNTASSKAHPGTSLTDWVRQDGGKGRMFRTPDAYARGGAVSPESRKAGGHSVNLQDQIGGKLNPPWVEWLMGWPIGWTALEPLATDKFQQWLVSHGGH